MDSYKIRNDGIYFVTFTVVDWIDVFSRDLYRKVLIDNLIFYRENRGLELYGYVVMTNHMHLLIANSSEPLSDTIRDYKKYTAKTILELIEDENESRRTWMLSQFRFSASKNSRNSRYQFWQQHNQPEECVSNRFLDQKLDYIHMNPVKAGFVEEPHHWLYSSARNYAGMPGLIEVTLI